VEQGRLASLKYGCVKCHSVDGSPHIGPTWLDMYHRQEQLEGGKTVLVDEAYITESMMDPKSKVVAGFQPVMPSFSGQITPPETAAIIEYIKSLRSDRLAQEAQKNP
jgi:cytochrome c oxidase subunit II